jgi:hypothetical protein
MTLECKMEDINPNIMDKTNMPNPWQGSLRFGYINQDGLASRVEEDFNKYTNANAHLVFTHMNYTNNKVATPKGLEVIKKPIFISSIIGSDKEDFMATLDM